MRRPSDSTCRATGAAFRLRRMKLRIRLFVGILLASGCAVGHATPNPATHVVQTPIGADESTFVYLETIHRYPGNYFDYTEIVRVVTRRKSDDVVVDSTTVSRVTRHRDPNDDHVLPSETDTCPPFDWTAFLRTRDLRLVKPQDFEPMGIDSVGIYFTGQNRRIYWVRSPDILRRLPPCHTPGDPTIRDVYRADEPWYRDERGRRIVDAMYLIVETGRLDSDIDGHRWILFVQRPPAPR